MAMPRCFGTAVHWRVWAPLFAKLYGSVTRYLPWWPLRLWRRPRRHMNRPRRIAYFTHAFPLLSETFVQREVRALREAGVDVVVFAGEARDHTHLDAAACELMRTTRYLDPIDRDHLRRARWHWALRRPLTLLNLFMYVVCRRHTARKSYRTDCELLDRSLYLAWVLAPLGITHVHAPWADTRELPALLAARLLRVPYSVQARAYDLYAEKSIHGVRERLTHAKFIITNSHVNEQRIRTLLRRDGGPRIHRIYNGIEPERFLPRDAVAESGVLHVLSVGRLVEQKGLEYLLRACALLRDAGCTVRCRIVGGRVPRQINYYISLQKLRRSLALDTVVTFLGAQSFDQVLTTYAEADVCVLPCVIAPDGSRDVTPNVLIEAMALQLPAVSTTVGAIPELIEDGVCGLLVPPRDEHALAAALLRLVRDPALRAALGVNARKRVEERFDIRKNIQAYVALFNECS
jgi:glycosyltransferase involved in cell wall biosynthesis